MAPEPNDKLPNDYIARSHAKQAADAVVAHEKLCEERWRNYHLNNQEMNNKLDRVNDRIDTMDVKISTKMDLLDRKISERNSAVYERQHKITMAIISVLLAIIGSLSVAVILSVTGGK